MLRFRLKMAKRKNKMQALFESPRAEKPQPPPRNGVLPPIRQSGIRDAPKRASMPVPSSLSQEPFSSRRPEEDHMRDHFASGASRVQELARRIAGFNLGAPEKKAAHVPLPSVGQVRNAPVAAPAPPVCR